ncbi:MAG: NUDIX hydrolase [Nocardioidaceae bacterium]
MVYTSEHPPFAVTVDIVLLTIRDDRLSALVVRRGAPPFEGRLALPGGFVEVDENLETAATRELAEETAVRMDSVHLEQLASYGEPDRDPRMRTVSVAWLAIAPDLPDPAAGTDAADAQWVPVAHLLDHDEVLAFDHRRILAHGVERAQAKLEYSTVGTAFCSAEFTVAELRHVYEVVWGRRLDPGNFHRKVTGAEGFVVETGERVGGRSGRPAQLFRRGPADLLHPPLTRTSLHAVE